MLNFRIFHILRYVLEIYQILQIIHHHLEILKTYLIN